MSAATFVKTSIATTASTATSARTSGRTSVKTFINNLRVLNTLSSSSCHISICTFSSLGYCISTHALSSTRSSLKSSAKSSANSTSYSANSTSYSNYCTTSCPNCYNTSYFNYRPHYPIAATATAVGTHIYTT
jgi:hypothetical protein